MKMTSAADISLADSGVGSNVWESTPSGMMPLTSAAVPAMFLAMSVIGAIQPSDFAEPSAQEVAALIDQIKQEHDPAIFGSEVFPSPVLAQIAQDTGVKYEDTLRDDDLPGDVGGPEHSYVGLIVYDVKTIAVDLGGDPSPLDGIPTKSQYD